MHARDGGRIERDGTVVPLGPMQATLSSCDGHPTTNMPQRTLPAGELDRGAQTRGAVCRSTSTKSNTWSMRSESLLRAVASVAVVGASAYGLAGTGNARAVASHVRSLDIAAMELARTAETAVEVISTDHDGSYATVTRRTIHRIEPLIPIVRNPRAWLSSARGTATTYSVTTTTPAGHRFTIKRRADGSIARTCLPVDRWCVDGDW